MENLSWTGLIVWEIKLHLKDFEAAHCLEKYLYLYIYIYIFFFFVVVGDTDFIHEQKTEDIFRRRAYFKK